MDKSNQKHIRNGDTWQPEKTIGSARQKNCLNRNCIEAKWAQSCFYGLNFVHGAKARIYFSPLNSGVER